LNASDPRRVNTEAYFVLDAYGSYRWRWLEAGFSIQNLTNTAWREAQFGNVSRLPNETGPASCPVGTRPVVDGARFAGCEDIHFTPGAPINVYGTVSLSF